MPINYQQLLDSINNLPPNATLQEKKNVLLDVAKKLDSNEEKDYDLRFKATAIKMGAAAQLVLSAEKVAQDLAFFKQKLEGKVPVAMEVEDGGRRKRRAKKTKSKSKKTRRYTRRR